ncbi:MAG: prepilin-type N-terminal cleavage/methylation domain-containing protein [Bacillaceae bacterium]|nr:prepilin-type N-terminal cleavage/methylation domain-containing protein [Bacillaceae bacterium]
MKNKEDGFTLVEILAAITILSIILLSIYAVFINSMKQSQNNDIHFLAFNLAANVLETIQYNYSSTGNCVDQQDIFPEYSGYFDEAEQDNLLIFNEKIFYVKAKIDCNNPMDGLHLLHVQIYKSSNQERLLAESFGYVP